MKKTILIVLTTVLFSGNIISSGTIKEVKSCKIMKDISVLSFSSSDDKIKSSITLCKNKDGSIKVFQTVSAFSPPKDIPCTLSFSNDYSEVTERCGNSINIWVDGILQQKH